MTKDEKRLRKIEARIKRLCCDEPSRISEPEWSRLIDEHAELVERGVW